MDTRLIELLAQHNILTATLSAFSSLKSPTFCTKWPISHIWENFHFNLYEQIVASVISQYVLLRQL